MDHNLHTKMKNEVEQKPNCVCGERCFACASEKLAVNCGCVAEAKQYEYALDERLGHETHNAGSEHKEHAGHDIRKMNHMDHEAAMKSPAMAKAMEKDMRRRFLISLALTIPIFLYSPAGEGLFQTTLPAPIPVAWLLFLLATPVVFWTGSIFITGTYYSLKARKLNMAVLIAFGVLATYFSSAFIMFFGGKETFYEAGAMLVTFVLFGHWLEMKSRRGTSDALRALFDLVPPQ